jgi:NitT/TauT family transport system substrate-binding protein
MQRFSRSAFLGSAALATLAPRLGSPQTLAPLRATSAIDDPATPFLYALQSGLFRKNGLDASIERATNGAASAAAVVGGSFETGKASVISFLSAHVHDLPLIAVAAAGDYDASNPNASLAVRSDSPIRSGADLNGKIVAVSALNDLFSIAARCWIDAHGGDSSTVKMIELPTSTAAEGVAAGRVDAAVIVEPFLDQAMQAGGIRNLGDPVAAIGRHHTDSVWFMTLDYVKKNPDVVNRFMRSIRDAAIYVNGHPAETAPLLIEFAKLKSSDVLKNRTLEGTRLDPANFQPMIDAAARYKVIPERFDARDLIYANALR